MRTPTRLVHLLASLCCSLVAVLVAGCGGGDTMSTADMSTCTAPQIFCGFGCANLMTDSGNCGKCGKSCLATEHCVSGQCASDKCGLGKTECGDKCVDLMVDGANCGACNTPCMPGQPCVGGKCQMACAAPEIPCGGKCVNAQTDTANCGACGVTCRLGEHCFHAACRLDLCGTAVLGVPGPPLFYTGGPSDLATGDLDGDGDPDLVVAGTVDVQLLIGNQNDHSFGKMGFMAKSAVGHPVIADYSGDGKMDIALVDGANKQVLIWRGDGKNAFVQNGMVAGGAGPHLLFGNDFNNDKIPDVALVNLGDGTITLALTVMGGTFKAPSTLPLVPGARSVVCGDLNGDNRADFAYADANGAVSLLLNLGDGTFNAPLAVTTPFTARALAIGDIDDNSKQDLVLGGDTQTVVMFNMGNNPFPNLKAGTAAATATAPVSMLVTDLDGEGSRDVVVSRDSHGRTDGAVLVLHGDGKDGLTPAVGSLDETQAGDLVAADFDSDGKIDVAFGQKGHDYAVGILHNVGKGSFALPIVSSTSADVVQLAGGDLDGDLAAELIVATDKLNVWKNDGNGHFTKGDELAVGGWAAVSVLDLDGDKDNDVVVYDGKTTLSIFLNAGGGKLGAPTTLMAYANAPYLVFGDLDADMKPELLQLGANGVIVYKNLGKGMFDTPTSYKANHTGPLVAGDFNNDGWTDVAVVDSPTSIGILVNKTRGVLAAPVSYPAGMNNATIATGDIDGDGKVDVVLSSALKMGGLVSVVLNDGDATFKAAQELGYPFAITVVLGDIDGDKRPEVIGPIGGSEQRGLGVMRNVKGRLAPLALYPGVRAGVLPVLVDGDGDGRLDVVAAMSGPGSMKTQALGLAVSSCLP